MYVPSCPRLLAAAILFSLPAAAQVIEFESGGLKYQTLTRSGLTVMFAHLPSHVREYVIIQVAISNGAQATHTIRPEDFTFFRQDAAVVRGASAGAVVRQLLAKASHNDVIRLVSAYEAGLYGMQRFRSTNGYEQRRQSAMAELTSARIKAAAAASAIALVETKLGPGQSTDGAVFFDTAGKPLGAGRLVFVIGKNTFEFHTEASSSE